MSRATIAGSLCALYTMTAGVPAAAEVRLVTLGAVGEQVGRGQRLPGSERAFAVAGSSLLEARGFVPRGFVAKLSVLYDRLEREERHLPTALPATQLGLQRPEAFDLVIVEPPPGAPRRPDVAAVFLHGYAGNVAAICWLVARAVAEHGARTFCPSIGFDGDWWAAHGARTLAATLRHLRGLGVRRVFLLGLSNGARGAAELAPVFERELDGLVLLSGISARARPARVPTLLLHGRRDPGVPAPAARRYLARAGPRAEEITVPGDHFVLVTREREVRRALARWLGRKLR